MRDCADCSLFQLESESEHCLHVNRPGGLGLTKTALASCALPEGASILDAACGTGATLRHLADQGYQAVGLDLSTHMLRSGQNLPRIQADCTNVPLPSNSLDCVLMECALSLTSENENALAEYKRLLRPSGWLVVTDLYIRELKDADGIDFLSNSSCLSGVQSEDVIRQRIKKAGFTIQHWQDQTPVFKQWLARMVFKLGSLDAFYKLLVSCKTDSQTLSQTLGSRIKLGYYCMSAQKNKFGFKEQ